jgi:hypothetical protein
VKIFLSWSGERSKAVALALRDWLPIVLHYAEPWISHTDIAPGERWSVEIGKELEATHFGLICLTKENLNAPWLLFEAGALSKSMDKGSVVPYLFDTDFSDVAGPLAQFQAKKADKPMTLEVILAINAKSERPIEVNRLNTLFQLAWPELERRLSAIPAADPGKKHKPARTQHDVLEDLVVEISRLRQRMASLEASTSRNAAILDMTDLIAINTKPLLGAKGKMHLFFYDKYRAVSELLDELWASMRDGPPPGTYGVQWVLRDTGSGQTLNAMGRRWAWQQGKGRTDERPLFEAGLLPGQMLEAAPIPATNDADANDEARDESAEDDATA